LGVVSLEYKWIALTVTTIGIFMVGLDSRIAIIGLPQIAQQLHAGAEQAIWITQSYVLATIVMLLLIGRLADIFGRAPIYSYGFAIFTIGSALVSLFLNIGLTISFNFVILFMSFTAPYDLITNVISGLNATAVTAADRMLFCASVKNTYFALGVINAMTIFPSLLQISRHRTRKMKMKRFKLSRPKAKKTSPFQLGLLAVNAVWFRGGS
jgi:MFS family permease